MNKKEILMMLDELIETDPGTLTGDEVLKELEGWDSLAAIEFLALVDEHLGIAVSPKQIATSKTVNDVLALLGDHLTG